MSEASDGQAEDRAGGEIDAAAEALAEDLAARLAKGERRALARAITLVESRRPDHRAAARALLARIAGPVEGRGDGALRIGLSGAPGVGKSTFVEAFGLSLIEAGHKVAVLAVDPSSARSGGSILGDKTRMERLSRAPEAFIRPSPSQSALGGVARRTREAILLCEAAGFDIVIVETVGVGQSETMVAEMTDIFVLLLAPGGGDDLQGVKRGIMEIADMILVNKADGELKSAAERTRADYAAALHLMRRRAQDPEGFPKAMPVSAIEETGLAKAWEAIGTLDRWRRESGAHAARRRDQRVAWMRREIESGLEARLRADPDVAALWPRLEAEVAEGSLLPEAAAERLLDAFAGGGRDGV